MTNKENFNYQSLIFSLIFLFSSTLANLLHANELSNLELHVIPYPQKVIVSGSDFTFKNEISIVLDNDRSVSDRFAAEELISDLKK